MNIKSYIKSDGIFWMYLKIREQNKINITDYYSFWKEIDLQINDLDDAIGVSVEADDTRE
jgi:hypothetical protein